MISQIEGIIKEKGEGKVVVMVGGVGFELLVSGSTLRELAEITGAASLYVHLHVREDLLQLFGFISRDEKEMFLKLISVSKVGPKLALAILSALNPDDLVRAIILGDTDLIIAVPGVGRKVAERLILEMKEKVEADWTMPTEAVSDQGSDYLKVRDALVGLGYSTSEAAAALKKGANESASVEEMIKAALKRLAKS